ncbi:hypothetical protein ACP70R_045094 [Stipagrostis hirtigluma subsp. patula]
MGVSRTEVNLLRLLDSAPRQQNQAKLVHYVTTSRELLEQLAAENSSEGISSISKEKMNEFSDKIKELTARLSPEAPDDTKAANNTIDEHYPRAEQAGSRKALSSGVRRRLIYKVEAGQAVSDKGRDTGAPIRLDAAAQVHIEKHRKLQEDLTNEMVVLARQLKESSLMMNQSVQETDKFHNFSYVKSHLTSSFLIVLDSTERAVEHSLARTGHANARALEVYSLVPRTTCFQWLLLSVMTCLFVMVVLLIRVT